jgi:hypothetical protein
MAANALKTSMDGKGYLTDTTGILDMFTVTLI